MSDQQNQLEQLLTAQVLTLSMVMEARDVTKGVRRIGADYSIDAVKLVKKKQQSIIDLLRATP